MSCSIGTLIGSECGTTSSKLNITQEKIPISLCQKDVSNHFHTASVTDISTEYDLILTRAGVFAYDKEYISRTTVCPSTDITSVEDGSRKESVATQTTQAKPSQIVVLTNYSPKSCHELKNLVPVG